jgi:hypothetical protein
MAARSTLPMVKVTLAATRPNRVWRRPERQALFPATRVIPAPTAKMAKPLTAGLVTAAAGPEAKKKQGARG